MIRAAAAVIALIAAAPAAAEPLAPAAFRDRLAAATAASVGHATSPIDDRTFKTRTRDGTELTVSIDTVYAQYLAKPADLDSIISRYVGVLTDGSRGTEPIDSLVIITRPTNYLVRSLPPGASLDGFVVSRPMAGDLAFFLAVDTPETIRPAMKADLTRWQIDEQRAWELARSHIKARVGAVNIVRLGDDNGAIGLGAESGLAPSVLADPGFCSAAAPSGMQGQIILVYSRDMFLFAVPDDGAVTQTFWRTVKQEVTAGRSISSTPITCRDGRWVVATAPSETAK